LALFYLRRCNFGNGSIGIHWAGNDAATEEDGLSGKQDKAYDTKKLQFTWPKLVHMLLFHVRSRYDIHSVEGARVDPTDSMVARTMIL